MVRPSGPGRCAVALVALLSAVADESDPYADLYASLLAGQLPGVLTAAGPGVFDDGRRLAYSYAPKLNATTKRGRLNYTYFSPAPFAYRDTANPWVSLGPDLTLYDASSADLKAAFFAFDGDSWDGDELRYPNAVTDIDGSYDPGSRTLVLWASPAQAKADWLAALRSVLYRAKASLSVKDRPNVHTRVVWISLLDVEGNRGGSFNVTIALKTATTIITDRSGVTLRDKA